MLLPSASLCIALFAFLDGVIAQQESLAGTNYPQVFDEGVDFTQLFSPKLTHIERWSQTSWNGLVTFARSNPLRCFGVDSAIPFDVAVLGAPFDTATSYRPGARFGPNGIRQGSRHLNVARINVPQKIRVTDFLEVADCGDVPMVLTDNKVALRQLELANAALLSRTSLRTHGDKSLAKDGKFHPRVLALGGDHTITLPLLRGVVDIYGPVSVIHFDSHIDTWKPQRMEDSPWEPGQEIPLSHDNYLWHAYKEGLLASNNTNIHVGIRGALDSWDDYRDDHEAGFVISHADDLEEIGWKGVVTKIRDTVGDNPVYISFDIDVIELGMAPATGTPEIGGITTREIKKILQGLSGLKIIGADIVEVAPGTSANLNIQESIATFSLLLAYDTQDEITQIVAANIGWHILALMAKTPLVA
ncbi:Arginase/deacetylase [Obba rivulosa]|uniref:Arginase/deacetylase n=1 Tax=Obba rivulosa TaxID=1052685 RepID=A0A8E2AYW3_9APHY|nr:Arginase/deacetylase [Obba rivulosa]